MDIAKEYADIYFRWLKDAESNKEVYQLTEQSLTKRYNVVLSDIVELLSVWKNEINQMDKSMFEILVYHLNHDMSVYENYNISYIQVIIRSLEEYKTRLNNVFKLSNIQALINQFSNNDNVKIHSIVYLEIMNQISDLIFKWQTSFQKIVFNCKNNEDRLTLLNQLKEINNNFFEYVVYYLKSDKSIEYAVQKVEKNEHIDYSAFVSDEAKFSKVMNLQYDELKTLIGEQIDKIYLSDFNGSGIAAYGLDLI